MMTHPHFKRLPRVRGTMAALRITLVFAFSAQVGCTRSTETSGSPDIADRPAASVARPSIRQYTSRHIVRLKTLAPSLDGTALEIARSLGGSLGRSWHLINGFEIGGLSDEALRNLRSRPDVKSVTPDGDDVVTIAQSVFGSGGLWGLDRIDQRLGQPLDGIFNYFFNGSGVRIYIVDSGIFPHADFSGRLGTGYSAIADPDP